MERCPDIKRNKRVDVRLGLAADQRQQRKQAEQDPDEIPFAADFFGSTVGRSAIRGKLKPGKLPRMEAKA